MKTLSTILLISSIGLLAIISCDDQSLEIEGLAPYVKARFINQDSIVKLDTAIADLNKEIKDVNDSINKLEELIDSGDDTDYSANFESLDDIKKALTADKSGLSKIKTKIKSGKMLLQWLAGDVGNDVVTHDDSLTEYSLPLNANADRSEFMLLIDSVKYGLTFQYERDTVYKEGAISIEANNIKLTNFTQFDSASFHPCDTTNCKSYEATATLYF